MKPLHLRFDSERVAIDALTSNGFSVDENGNLHHEKALIDVIGVINGKPIMDDFFNVIGYEPDLYGWHVNLLVPDDIVPPKSAVILDVKTPARKWAGY